MTSLAEKSKGLLEIGEHCAQCNKIDFLPFKCYDCEKTFCSEHKNPQLHGCKPVKSSTLKVSRPPSKSTSPSPSSASSRQSSVRDAVASAAVNRARTVSPSAGSNSTSKPSTKPTNPPAALERLKALWAKKTASSSTSSSKPKKVNPLAALAELKRTAKGDEKIPSHERIYFYVVRPSSEVTDTTTGKIVTRPEKKLPVYFKKDLIVGRALDKVCELLAISNKNNTGVNHKLGFYDGDLFIPYNEKLFEKIKDGKVIIVK